jgi:hypothetical protein
MRWYGQDVMSLHASPGLTDPLAQEVMTARVPIDNVVKATQAVSFYYRGWPESATPAGCCWTRRG